jgi:hypothetical protein
MSYIMSCDPASTVKVNLQFNLLFPLFKTPFDALNRFHSIHDYLSTTADKGLVINKDQHRKLVHECDYLLNLLEDF